MYSVDFKSTIPQLNAKMAKLAYKQLPFAASVALNKTAKQLLAYNKLQMKRRFKNPVPYTLNAFRVERSTKTNLMAGVVIKDKPGGKHYLPIQTTGGARGKKGVEKMLDKRIAYPGIVQAVIPTSREAGGKNGQAIVMSRINKVLAGLGASYSTSAYTRNAQRAAESKRNLAKRPVRYFVAEPTKGRNKSGGIYRVNGKKGKPQKLYHILDYRPQYQAKLPFKEYMTKVAIVRFPKNFNRSFKDALKTSGFGLTSIRR